MLAARLIEKLADARQLLDNWLVFGNFAIEHTQRIRHRTALAVGTHFVFYRIQRPAQSFVVSCAIVGASDRIELQLPSSNSKPIEQRRKQFDDLGVARR